MTTARARRARSTRSGRPIPAAARSMRSATAASSWKEAVKPISRVSRSSARRPASTGACVVVTMLPGLDGSPDWRSGGAARVRGGGDRGAARPGGDGPGRCGNPGWHGASGGRAGGGGGDRCGAGNGGAGLGQAAAQVTAGAVLVPVELAVKPQVVLAPAASEPLYGALRAVTASPELVTVAFQVLVKRWPLGQVHVTVHEVIAALPALTVTAPWK